MDILKALKESGLFPLTITTLQAQSITALYNSFLKHGDGDFKKLAYIYATAYWEAAKKLRTENGVQVVRIIPVEEIGQGKNRAYGKIDPITKKAYYGRGFVQLTWKGNYQTMGRIIGVDLVNNPDYLLTNVDDSAHVAVIGMYRGLFTGKKLSDYINDATCDYVNARRIINGTDKANEIAGFANKFLNSIQKQNQQ